MYDGNPTFCTGRQNVDEELKRMLPANITLEVKAISGRTTDLDEHDLEDPSSYNGRTALNEAMTEKKYDFLILQLRINNVREPHNQTTGEVCDGIKRLVDAARSHSPSIGICVVAPPKIGRDDNMTPYIRNLFAGKQRRMAEVRKILESVARDNGCLFTHAELIEEDYLSDGVHLAEDQNPIWAALLYGAARELCGDCH